MFKHTLRIFHVAGLLLAFALSAASAEPVKIVAFGDSLVAGYGLDAGKAFPEQLQGALDAQGIDAVVENAGVSGDTTSGGLARLDWSTPADTDIVILELGANDALRGISPDITRAKLDQMLASLKARGIDVILAGMLAPPNMGPDYAEAFNPIYPELAAKHGVTLYPFFLDGVTTVPGMTLEDGMHPNDAGVAEMVKRFLPVLVQAIEARKGA